jgi:lipopolysaccharide transport system ATP-binding protein
LWINEGEVKAIGDTLNVTAQYSEFMFSNIQNPVNRYEEKEAIDVADNKCDSDNSKELDKPKGEIKAINRWGMNEGMIESVELLNSNNIKKDIFEFGEWIKIRIKAHINKDIDLASLSFAISIKNSMGLDLVVSTTKDYEGIIFNRKDCDVIVEFVFKNVLAVSDYILVVAVENRSNIVPEYYDYIEGARCFKVVNDKQLFGLIHIDVNKNVEFL